MKRDQLKPYVFKVEGASKFVLYNMMTGSFYRFSKDGNVEELRNVLLKEELIFKTEGVVPHKIVQLDLMELKNEIFLRELQIRGNGRGENNCWNRRKNKGKTCFLPYSILIRLKEMCKYIPIKKIRIEAEVYEKDKVEMILKEFNVENVELFVESGMDAKQTEYLKENYHGTSIRFSEDGKKRIKDKK